MATWQAGVSKTPTPRLPEPVPGVGPMRTLPPTGLTETGNSAIGHGPNPQCSVPGGTIRTFQDKNHGRAFQRVVALSLRTRELACYDDGGSANPNEATPLSPSSPQNWSRSVGELRANGNNVVGQAFEPDVRLESLTYASFLPNELNEQVPGGAQSADRRWRTGPSGGGKKFRKK